MQSGSSLNFRMKHQIFKNNGVLDKKVLEKIDEVYSYLHQESIERDQFVYLLNIAFLELQNYYKSGMDDAYTVFCQFCQHLVYYICHNIKDRGNGKNLLSTLLNYPMFFHRDPQGKLILYVDPKEGFTFLTSLCRSGYVDAIKQALQIRFDKITSDLQASHVNLNYLNASNPSKGDYEFFSLLTTENRQGYSPLITACAYGDPEIVALLLKKAECILDSNQVEEYNHFFTHRTVFGSSSLNVACKQGHTDIVEMILNKAEAILPPDDFFAFITNLDAKGFSPLASACYQGHTEIVKRLLVKAERVLKGVRTAEYMLFLQQLNREGQSHPPILYRACNKGHDETVMVVLQAIERAYGGVENDQYKGFLKQEMLVRPSLLAAACYMGYVPIVKKLLDHVVQAYGGVNSDRFIQCLTFQDRAGCTLLNSACAHGHVEMVKLLLGYAERAFGGVKTDKYQAFLTLADCYGISPYEAASIDDHHNVMQILNNKQMFDKDTATETRSRKKESKTITSTRMLTDRVCKEKTIKTKSVTISSVHIGEGASAMRPNVVGAGFFDSRKRQHKESDMSLSWTRDNENEAFIPSPPHPKKRHL